mgnify:CR=1 FL=1
MFKLNGAQSKGVAVAHPGSGRHLQSTLQPVVTTAAAGGVPSDTFVSPQIEAMYGGSRFFLCLGACACAVPSVLTLFRGMLRPHLCPPTLQVHAHRAFGATRAASR